MANIEITDAADAHADFIEKLKVGVGFDAYVASLIEASGRKPAKDLVEKVRTKVNPRIIEVTRR